MYDRFKKFWKLSLMLNQVTPGHYSVNQRHFVIQADRIVIIEHSILEEVWRMNNISRLKCVSYLMLETKVWDPYENILLNWLQRTENCK